MDGLWIQWMCEPDESLAWQAHRFFVCCSNFLWLTRLKDIALELIAENGMGKKFFQRQPIDEDAAMSDR